MPLTHIDSTGGAKMVDVSGKPAVRRAARASAKLAMSPETIRLVREGLVKKGDVLAVARVAGIAAAKKTGEMIPLCHSLRLDCVTVEFELHDDAVSIETTAVCTDRTGVEMEALSAATVAALTVYDMCKAVDRNMTISDIRLIEKTKSEEM